MSSFLHNVQLLHYELLHILQMYFFPFCFSSMDFTVREYGLQIDQPPAIGNLSSLMVIIQNNDNAEGILEFDPNMSTSLVLLCIPYFFLYL